MERKTAEDEQAPPPKSVLVIDDDEGFRVLIRTFLAKTFPGTTVAFFDPLQQEEPPADFPWSCHDVLIMDYDLGRGRNGLDWLRKYQAASGFPATIMLTAHGNEELAVEAMRFGAQDYINKAKLSMDRLAQSVKLVRTKRQRQVQLSTTMSLQSNVFNKVTFYRKVKETTAKQMPGTFSFLMQIQVRNFGEMQKQHGPLRTDAFCNHVNDVVAKLILGMKLTPNVVRTGDATVACLIRECDDAGAGERAALNICADTRFALQVDPEHRLESPVNVGVVAVKTGDDVEALLMRADLACQTAIEKGPNTCHVHLPDAAATTKSEALATPARTPVTAKLTIDLAGIIKSNSIQPSYQPYIALSETATSVKARYYQVQLNLIVGPEQTVRAHDLHLHQVTSGNPGMLDLWVTRHMLGQLLNLEQEGEGTKCGLFIRLFPETLSQNILFNWMQDLLKKSRNPGIASTIVFELYPPDFLAHKKNFMNFINQMRDTWGVAFALYDVVNTGVLETCVKQGGFEFVKFAMEEKGMQTVAQISARARELGALTVIQNIGSAQQLATAIELGFDYGQGEFVQPSIDNLLLGNEVITI